MSRLETVPASVPPTNHSPRSTKPLSIGQYLIRRLQDYGLKHVFGIPGDYILTFYGQLEPSPRAHVSVWRVDRDGWSPRCEAPSGHGAVRLPGETAPHS